MTELDPVPDNSGKQAMIIMNIHSQNYTCKSYFFIIYKHYPYRITLTGSLDSRGKI